jgi:hypothetical protein
MKLRPFTRNLVLRFGLAITAVGLLSTVLLLIYNHGLEDTLPFTLYLIAFVALPVGLVLCLAGVIVNLVRARSKL